MAIQLLPATLADSVTIWPSLLQLARCLGVPMERRRSAVFWLGQAAGAAVDRSPRLHCRRPGGPSEKSGSKRFLPCRSGFRGSVPALIRIARTNPDPELRKTALFWLGQSDDPRALDLFEEILR